MLVLPITAFTDILYESLKAGEDYKKQNNLFYHFLNCHQAVNILARAVTLEFFVEDLWFIIAACTYSLSMVML